MPITRDQFDQVDQLSPHLQLRQRVLQLVQESELAHTAEEITAKLLDVGKYALIFSADVREQAPIVRRILDDFTAAGTIEKRRINRAPVGERDYYRRIDPR